MMGSGARCARSGVVFSLAGVPHDLRRVAWEVPVTAVGKLDGKLRVVIVLPPTGRLASDFSTLVPAD
jgi:hypothetical protein